MRDYSGVIRSILVSMLLIAAMVISALGVMAYNDSQDDAARAALWEEIRAYQMLTKGG